MSLTRARQVAQLATPTRRAMTWGPLLACAPAAAAYVHLQAPQRYIEFSILLLRIAAVALCLGLAFVLDDPTEGTLGHVPTPALMRRLLRVALAIPLAAASWGLSIQLAGPVPASAGGPLPVGDLTLEASALLAVTLLGATLGRRIVSGMLGGLVGGTLMLGLVSVAAVLPYDHQLLIKAPGDPRWGHAHDLWRDVLMVASGLFVVGNLDRARRGFTPRIRTAARRALGRRVDPQGTSVWP